MTKKELYEEKEKLSRMNPKDKLSYIFTYYSTQLIIAAVVIFIIVQVIGILVRLSREDVLYCLFVNETQLSSRDCKDLESNFRSYAEITDKDQVITFDISLDLDDSAYSDASVIKLESLQSTGTLDVIITTEEIIDRYKDDNLYMDLSTVLPDEMYAALSDRFYCTSDADGQPVPLGIRLEDSVLAQQLPLAEDSCLCVASLEHYPEVVFQFIRYCFGM